MNVEYYARGLNVDALVCRGHLQCGSFVKLRGSCITGHLTTPLFVALSHTQIKGIIKSASFVDATESTVQDIGAQGAVKLLNKSTAGRIESESYVEIRESNSGDINAGSFIRASQAKIGRCEANRGRVTLEGNTTADSVLAGSWVNIESSKVNQYVLSRHKGIILRNSEIGQAHAINGSLNIFKSTVTDGCEVLQVISCQDAVIKGMLKCHNLSLEIIRSTIAVLLLGDPQCLPPTPLTDTPLMSQMVILKESTVACIIFSKPGGVVKILGKASVATVENGVVEVD